MSNKSNRVDLEEYRRAARAFLPKMVFDYVEGGAGSERGLVRNRAAFEECLISPRRLVDVAKRDQSIRLFGTAWSSPFAVAPMGLAGVIRPDGDLMLARAAERAGIPFCLSTASTTSIEDIARKTNGELWFQLYVVQRDLADRLVERAAAVGCKTLMLTVDVPVNGERLRDARSGFRLPLRYTPRLIADALGHPGWALRQVRAGFPQLVHFADPGTETLSAQAALMQRQMDASFDWAALARLRDRWQGTLLVKGVLRSADVGRCEAIGVDSVVLSNHGGRQLDDVPAPLTVLPKIARDHTMPLLLDSGVRHGGDVLKALASGASAVLLGRPLLYGLAADGQNGVDAVLALIRSQLDNWLALTGCDSIEAIDDDILRF